MLIIHHWDTDGICSAAKLIKALGSGDKLNMSPEIGEFSFGDRIKDAVKEHEDIFVVDLNLPEEAKTLGKKLTFIDHHIQDRIEDPLIKHINPMVEGSDPSDFPSCSTVISEHFGQWDLLSALGALGDIGVKAIEHPRVREELKNAGISLEDGLRIVSLIDSNYLACDIVAVEDAVSCMMEMGPADLLRHPEWNRKLEDIERTLRSTLSGMEEIGRFCYMEYESPYNIISKLARKAVWDMGYEGALVINRDFHGKCQTYLRVSGPMSERMDMGSLISRLKEMGINAGGKKEVLGSVYPKEGADEVISVLRPIIEGSGPKEE